jgi:hypothetical protein
VKIQAGPSSMIKLARAILICSALLLGTNSCVIPWFPNDPHDEAVDLLRDGEATRDTLVNMIGPPDFVLDESSYVWFASKIDAYLALPYNLGGAISDRDFTLAVDFDPSGAVIRHEVFARSGLHDFCFNNGICFAPRTLNVPLAPPERDMKAKTFEPDPLACVVYVYRDTEGSYTPNDDYVHINVSTKSSDQNEKTMTYLEHHSMASVPGSYSYWNLPAPVSVQVQALYDYPLSYGFGVDNKADGRRPWDKTTFDCNAGTVKYVRLFVPERRKHLSELDTVTAEQAKNTIEDLSLVMKLGWGGFFGKVEPEILVTDPD